MAETENQTSKKIFAQKRRTQTRTNFTKRVTVPTVLFSFQASPMISLPASKNDSSDSST